MRHHLHLLPILLLFIVFNRCGTDPQGQDESLVIPSFIIDTTGGNGLLNGDTVGTGSFTFSLIGNSDDNRYRWRIDDGSWTDWNSPEDSLFTITVHDLDTGSHQLSVEARHGTDTLYKDTVLTFFRAEAPYLIKQTDSSLSRYAGTACTLYVEASGTGCLMFQWYRNSVELSGDTTATIVIDSLSVGDGGEYFCAVENRWGRVMSGQMFLGVVEQFTVTYRCNGCDGGIVPIDSGIYDDGAAVRISGEKIPVRTGYLFNGWNDSADGSGRTFAAGDTIASISSDLVLYAQWEKIISWRIMYKGNGTGSAPVDTGHYERYETIRIAEAGTGFVKPGYLFTGWNDSANGKGMSYDPGTVTVMDTADIVLYAQWKRSEYLLSFRCGDGTGTAKPQPAYYAPGTAVALPYGSDCNRYGYQVDGWTEKPDGSGTVIPCGDAIVIDTVDLILYVHWIPVRFTIFYDGNGETAGNVPSPDTVTFGEPFFAAAPETIIRATFDFIGWCCSADGKGRLFTAGGKYDADTLIDTLYAAWIPHRYKLVYYGNGGSSGSPPDSSTFTVDTTFMISDKTGLERQSYLFTHWNTRADGGGEDFDPGRMVSNRAEDLVLYARWSFIEPLEHIGRMVKIAAENRTFLMGRADTVKYEDQTKWRVEVPRQPVRFTYDYLMDTTEVTQKQFDAVMAAGYGARYSKPLWVACYGVGDNVAAHHVSAGDAMLYCNARSRAEGLDTVYGYTSVEGSIGRMCTLVHPTVDCTKKGYRLPTEEEWEYACRGGTRTDFYWNRTWTPTYPSTDAEIAEFTSYCLWQGYSSVPGDENCCMNKGVASKKPNAFGLYDMAGGLNEYVHVSNVQFHATTITDPKPSAVEETGEFIVSRGGNYGNKSVQLRSACRVHDYNNYAYPFWGFRTVREVE